VWRRRYISASPPRHAQRLDLALFVRLATSARQSAGRCSRSVDVLRQDGMHGVAHSRAGVARRRLLSRAGWQVIGTSPKGELIFHSSI